MMGTGYFGQTQRLDDSRTETQLNSGPEPSISELHHLLANPRRRYVIASLQAIGEPVAIGTLAERLIAWEEGIPITEVGSHQRKTGYTALQQRHLPKLDEAGLIEFDDRSGMVQATPVLAEIDIYTEIVPKGGFPWSYYYLGLAGVISTLLLARWWRLLPEVLQTELGWGIFATCAFGLSALVHIYYTKQSTLEMVTSELEGVQ